MESGGEATRRYDVFLSYHGADRVAVERIATNLRAAGLDPFFDKWCLTPGKPFQEELVEALRSSDACAICVGPQGLGDWVRHELNVALDRAAKDRSFRLFMVLLPGAPEPLDPNLAILATRTWVDLRRPGPPGDDGMPAELAAAIGGLPPGPTPSLSDDEACPYRGLEPFDEEHAHFFFGRDDDVARVIERLRASRFVAVVGPSGSGKSSLVKAGVVPAIRGGAQPASEAWPLRRLTPGARPLGALGAQLAQLVGGGAMQATLDGLRADERTLDLAATLATADGGPQARVVVVVDQFEEVFTLCTDEAERAAFLANLCYAATMPGGRVIVIVAIRADFYHRAADYPALAALLSSQQYLVSPLSRDDLRQVVEAPAARVGLVVEPGLTDTILDDVADRPGTLPLLEHVLLEVWTRRRGRTLTLDAYVASGGVDGALAQRADTVYRELTPERQAIARRVLLRLTQPGEGTEDTRRRATMDELVREPAEVADVDAVVNALADARLVTASRDETSGSRVVDITHEALIRAWPALRGWINDGREHLRLARRLTQAAAEWEATGHDEGLLYRGVHLALWAEQDEGKLNPAERAFLAASRNRAASERASRRRRVQLVMGGLSTALAVVTVMGLVAVGQRNTATTQGNLARSRQVAASARLQLDVDPERALLLALEAHRMRPTSETESVLRQAVVDSRLRATLRGADGHDGPVTGVDFSPDGTRVASGGEDGTVRVWEWAAKAAPVVLEGHQAAVTAVDFSPDGNRVASASDDGTVRLWDWARDGADPVVLREDEAGLGLAGVAFGPDGATLATAGNDGVVRVWTLDQAEAPPMRLEGHDGEVWDVDFSPDGARLSSAGGDETVRVWDWASRSAPVVLRGHDGPVYSVEFSPDGAGLASGGQDGTARVWDWANPKAAPVVLDNVAGVTAAAFSPDGRQLATAGFGNRVRIWDWRADAVLVDLRGYRGAVDGVAFSADGGPVATAGRDGTVRVWESVRGRLFYGSSSVGFSHDGRRLVGGGGTGLVVADRQGDDNRVIEHPWADVYGVAVSGDGRLVASAGSDGAVRVWDLSASGEPRVLAGHDGPVRAVSFTADGRWLASAGDDGTVRVWDLSAGGQARVLRGHDGGVNDVAFSPDSRLLASAGHLDKTVRVWDWASRSAPVVLEGHEGSVNGVDFSPDGRWVASAGSDGTVRVWDWDGTAAPAVLEGHSGDVNAVSFSPEVSQHRLASVGHDGVVRVWEWDRGGPSVALGRDATAGIAVAFSPDGLQVASAGAGDSLVRDCTVCGPTQEVERLARRLVTRPLTADERRRFLPSG